MTDELFNKLNDIRSELFDAEALLLYLKNPDSLRDILGNSDADVLLLALLEKACALVSDATGWSSELIDEFGGRLPPTPTVEEAA